MWQRYNQCTEYRIQNVIEVSGALNQGFPFSPLLPHFRGLRDGVEYKFLDIPPRHRDGKSQCRFVMVRVSPSHPYNAGRAQDSDRGGLGGCEQMCTLHAVVVLCVCLW